MNEPQLVAGFNGEDHLEPGRSVSRDKTAERQIITHFCHVESRKIFLEDVSFYQQIEEIPAAHIFENLIESGRWVDEIDRLLP